MNDEEIAGVTELARAAALADGHAPLGEHKWLDLVQGGRADFAGFLAREADNDQILGYAQLLKGPSSWAVEYVVRPERRGEDDLIGQSLLAAALAEVARQGGGHVHLWVPKPTAAHERIAAALGLRRGRELLQLRRRLPLEDALLAKAEADVRTFRVGTDEAAWVELNAKAFAGHPEQGGWELETLLDREAQPWFDPQGFLLHTHEGALDAFCWTKVHEEERLGEIYVIGVDPGRQGLGLGASMLAAGLAYLGGRGLPTAMLYVDADNAAANRLYESFGFTVDHHDRAYVIDVAGEAGEANVVGEQ